MRTALLLLALCFTVFVAGCTQTPSPTQACTDYCQGQAHAQCDGSWNVSGTYPDCSCIWKCNEQPPQTCMEYCYDQPHAQCVGSWNISGTYPDCLCAWNCEQTGPEIPSVSDSCGNGVCENTEFTLKEGETKTFSENSRSHTLKLEEVTTDGSVGIRVDGAFRQTFTLLAYYEVINFAKIDFKEAKYVSGGQSTATFVIGENSFNCPDCKS